jgi:hemolysin activation/secretion protein
LSKIARNTLTVCILPLVVLWAAGREVHAQSLDGRVSTGKATEPGQIEKRITPPKARRVPGVPVAPEIPAAPPGEEIIGTFMLTGVEFVGATVYDPAAFGPFYEDLLGRKISVGDVERIIARATGKYRADGYALARLVADPQSLGFGVLRIRVIEGFVSRYTLAGDVGSGADLIRRYAQKILDSAPLRLAVLERYLLLMGDIPGVGVQPKMKELDLETGSYELVIRVKRAPLQPFASIDNRGIDPVGPLQALAGANLDNLLGLNERTRLLAFVIPDEPSELKYYDLRHEQIIGGEGTKVELAFSRSRVDFYSTSHGIDQKGWNRIFAISGSHPLIRTRDLSFSLSTGFEHVRSVQDAQDSSHQDRLRVLRLGGEVQYDDMIGGSNFIAIQVSQGLDILSASNNGAPELSRTDGRIDFTKLTLDATRQQTLPGPLALQLEAMGQWSAAQLLSSEEMAIGGSRFGRGYDSSELSSDDGIAVSAEIQYPKALNWPMLKTVSLYGFYDFGAVWAKVGGRDSLASAGFGLRFMPIEGLTGSLEFAQPLTASVAEKGNTDGRVFFSLIALL